MPDILMWLVFPFRRVKQNGKLRTVWFHQLPDWMRRDLGDWD
ncbi:hypothetical protein ACFSM5_05950 [Lacibacterium aquatile]|uniref:Uncharacterized protein n=1 Tax=Lacibacterium aquatile TaxID=1168082 RepID=A0ABW5DR94_9PROT